MTEPEAWWCEKYPRCECFAGCQEKALENRHRTTEPRYERWVLVTREAGKVISCGYFHTEQMALDELNVRQEEGALRSYEIYRQEVRL